MDFEILDRHQEDGVWKVVIEWFPDRIERFFGYKRFKATYYGNDIVGFYLQGKKPNFRFIKPKKKFFNMICQ